MESMDSSETDSEDNLDFYFESAHLALRGNVDYLHMVKTLSLLSCAQIQASKDYENLIKLRKEALDDPEEFVKKLSNKDTSLEFPTALKIPEIPHDLIVKYDKSSLKVDDERDDVKMSENNFDKFEEDKTDNNLQTLGKPWTSEEQRRLEELLIEYPPEQFEMRRFAKISRALGNRTTKQVASRVQKFFLKLHSAGLPIPGRIPKTQKHVQAKAHRFNKNTFKPSTFFPAHDVPVKISDDDDFFNECISTFKVDKFGQIDEKYYKHISNMESNTESDNENNTIIKLSNDQRILRLLKTVRDEKEINQLNEEYMVTHFNYKCNLCNEEPIIGTRWHCSTCKKISVNYCSDCLISQLLSDNPHPLNHNIVKFSIKQEINLNQTSNYESSDDE